MSNGRLALPSSNSPPLWRWMCLNALMACGLVDSVGRASATEPVDYTTQIKPILVERCLECHGPAEQESGLRLDCAALAAEGGNRGAALVAGKSAQSNLVAALRGGGDIPRMPPEEAGEPLSAEQIELLARWIDEGAISPPDEKPLPTVRKKSDHWAFAPIARPAVPTVRGTAALRNGLDAFILARLEAAGLEPSPEADRVTLLRRLSLDLIGLPPTPAEVAAFVADTEDGAYERAVDRLLASPHYGERWGRHWLDAARYADSNGYTIDGSRSIWKYRDWVIESLNRDLPFDQFAIEQLAGDLLSEATLAQQIATGFHRNTLRNEEGGTDAEQFRVEAVADRVETTGSVFLGLTVGCARCHDHKFDPLSQREYYQLFAIFNTCDEPTLDVPTDQQAKELPAIASEIEQTEKRLADTEVGAAGRQAEWEQSYAGKLEGSDLPDDVRTLLAVPAAERSKKQLEAIRQAYRQIDKDIAPLVAKLDELGNRKKQLRKSITTTLVIRERKKPRATHVQIRGDFLRPGARVRPAAPAVLPPLEAADGQMPGRLDFARWLFDRRNPLTARVAVNRIWQQYFGQGLVVTENDFGTQGSPPSHPELLDWLACELVDSSWSLKSLHRLIVTSATYRRASLARPDVAEKDPLNKLLARQSRLRLDAEVVRDVALASSGLLSREIGGPGVYPPQADGVYRFTQLVKFWGKSTGPDRYRRGMYTFFWRASPYPFLTTFDAPDGNVTCTRRSRSNTPLQALTLANDQAFVEMAQALARRVVTQVTSGDTDRLRHAFELCLARQPSEVELTRLAAYLAAERQSLTQQAGAADAIAGLEIPAGSSAADLAAWTAVARVLMNLDEFITRE